MNTTVEITEVPVNPRDRTASIYSVTVGGEKLDAACFTRAEAEDLAARHIAGLGQPDEDQGQDQAPDKPTRRRRSKRVEEERDDDEA
jgi:hypothetical protein